MRFIFNTYILYLIYISKAKLKGCYFNPYFNITKDDIDDLKSRFAIRKKRYIYIFMLRLVSEGRLILRFSVYVFCLLKIIRHQLISSIFRI